MIASIFVVVEMAEEVRGEEPESTEWTRYYDHNYDSVGIYDSLLDFATDMTIDKSGNIYVTGWSINAIVAHETEVVNYDYATICYSAEGGKRWVARYNGPGEHFDGGEPEDYPTGIAVDNSGNTYVTGYSFDTEENYDYATVAYDPSGNELWVARYDRSDYKNYPDIAVDNLGNVYITGPSTGVGTGKDYTTIAYDSSGNELWVVRYNGPGNGDDIASALVVDNSENIIVTGKSTNTAGFYEYATVAYDSSGNELWVARYGGLVNGDHVAGSIAIDPSGNIIVAGTSAGTAGSDYATIAYDPSGNELWVARYNGPGNGDDTGGVIAFDNSGIIYVAGYSEGIGTGYDYATIAYDSSGNELWVARYNGPPGNANDMIVDIGIDETTGNVFVTGLSIGIDSDDDITTVAYDSFGNKLWVVREDGIVCGLEVDISGNIFVAGIHKWDYTNYDYVTIKYLPDQPHHTPIADAGSDQTIIVGAPVYFDGSNSYDLDGSIVSYEWDFGDGHNAIGPYANHVYTEPGEYQLTLAVEDDDGYWDYDGINVEVHMSGVGDGAIEWTRYYDHYSVDAFYGDISHYDCATDMTIDMSGNIYVTGTSVNVDVEHETGLINYDYATISYGPNGGKRWVARYNGPGYDEYEEEDYPTGIAVDNSGNTYVTGYSFDTEENYDYATVAYDSSGNELWVVRYDRSDNKDFPDIAVDNLGHAYITGSNIGVGTGKDYTTIAYDSSGNELWVVSYDGLGNGDDIASALVVDNSGNIIVTGRSTDATGFYEYATVAYDSSGNELWVARYGGLVNGDHVAGSIAIDPSGNIIVAGTSAGTAGSDYATIAYDSSGNELWVARYNGPGDADDEGYAIAFDNLGTVYVTGNSIGYGTGKDYATVAYDSSGNELWVARYNGPGGNKDDLPVDIATDKTTGNVYVTGLDKDIVTNEDIATVAYDSSGNMLWVVRYGDIGFDWPCGIEVDNSGNIYGAGTYSWYTDDGLFIPSFLDYVTLKYYFDESPIADAGPDQTVIVGDTVQFDGSNSYDLYGTIVSYDWNFDDGSPYISGVSPTHIYNEPGEYTVILIVRDNNGAFGEDSITITVNPFVDVHWHHQFGTPDNDESWAVSTHDSGVYVAGFTEGILDKSIEVTETIICTDPAQDYDAAVSGDDIVFTTTLRTLDMRPQTSPS
jgi:hypothetical protein